MCYSHKSNKTHCVSQNPAASRRGIGNAAPGVFFLEEESASADADFCASPLRSSGALHTNNAKHIKSGRRESRPTAAVPLSDLFKTGISHKHRRRASLPGRKRSSSLPRHRRNKRPSGGESFVSFGAPGIEPGPYAPKAYILPIYYAPLFS